jgi:hypothetical protein
MPLAKEVVAIEHDFINLLQHIPGTKKEKQGYFRSHGIQVPRTNYDSMWDALTTRLHRSGAASVVFDLPRTKMPRRVSALLRTVKRGNPVNLHVSDPAVVYDLFFQNGNLRRIDGRATQSKPYDIAFSFAGENRSVVEIVAQELKAAGVRVFYDAFEQVRLLGKDLVSHFAEIYRNRAEYCAMFISEPYVRKAWPKLERQHAQARALGEKREYILPIRLDHTEVPGLSPTIGYLDARNKSPKEIAQVLLKKVREHRA